MGISFLSVTNRECPKGDLKLMMKSHWLLRVSANVTATELLQLWGNMPAMLLNNQFL